MKKDIVDVIQKMSGRYTPYQIFTDWVKMMAISIQNSCFLIQDKVWKERENEYLDIVKKYTGDEVKLFCEMMAWLTESYEEEIGDLLGEIYMESGSGSKSTGQFFTPFHIQEMCSNLVIYPQNDEVGIITINEPSCGGGGMIIAAIKSLQKKGIDYKRRVRVVAQDLDWNAVYMAYVQLSLLGISATVTQGNTLQDIDIRKYSKERVFYTPAKMGVII